ncbi:hypothetical protein [Streptomyces hawaiiensis]|uniref:hypothetical protein n=1 Tax=Streptomyces hawaiiensis TaxID=67305 RepID=UPI00365749A0
MPEKPKMSEPDAGAAPTPELSTAPHPTSAPDAVGPISQGAELDDLSGETWSNFSEVDDELDELPER